MGALSSHPLANVFPLLEGREFDDLVEDIRANGLRESIKLLDGQILDGRNRYRACLAAEVEPHFDAYGAADAYELEPVDEYDEDFGRAKWKAVWRLPESEDYERELDFSAPFLGPLSDPAAYVVSLNLRRRHLDESQRSIVAAKLANVRVGDNQHETKEGSPIGEATSQGRAAELLNVGKRSVERAREVLDEGAPELVEAVERGEVSVSAAAVVASLPKAEQTEIVARGEREILQAAKQINAQKAEARRVERLERIAEISKGNVELKTSVRYPVICADPPWRYENPPMGASSRSIENHYPTMTLEEICALPVADITTPDAILYLWATAPKLAECMQVINAWGFEYRTNFVWVKDKIGMGYHARNQHELLLVAKKGSIPPPAVADRVSSVIYGDRCRHSEKPDASYELIEKFYPQLPKIELFCRVPRPGWAVWGNQSEAA